MFSVYLQTRIKAITPLISGLVDDTLLGSWAVIKWIVFQPHNALAGRRVGLHCALDAHETAGMWPSVPTVPTSILAPITGHGKSCRNVLLRK